MILILQHFVLLVEGLRESKIGEIKYPDDANSTLRLTYGKVRSYQQTNNDAKINNYTTLGRSS